MIRRSIECTHDNGTVHTIGHCLINIVPTWPLHIQFNMPSTVTSDSQLSFSWVPAVSDCPTVDIRYYILSANCGICPFVDASTSITCTDVPSCGACILAVQTAVNDYTIKDLLSNPVYVFLNRIETSSAKNCTPVSSNNSEINIGPASIASTAVLAVALILCIIMIIMALRFTVKKKARSLKSLQRAEAEKHQVAEVRPYEPTEPTAITHLKSDCVSVENTVYA